MAGPVKAFNYAQGASAATNAGLVRFTILYQQNNNLA